MKKLAKSLGFAPGTWVDTRLGPRFIESIKVGDLVRTRNPRTRFFDGIDGYQRVPNDIYRPVKEIVVAQCDSMMRLPFNQFSSDSNCLYAGVDQCFHTGIFNGTDSYELFSGVPNPEFVSTTLSPGLTLPWIPVSEVLVGYGFLAYDEPGWVSSFRRTRILRPTTSYSLRVDKFNTFFVGQFKLWTLGASYN